MNRRRIFEAFHQTRPPDADDWMPLAKAAKAVREVLRGSDLDLMSRGLGETDDSVLSFWAHHVAQMGVTVYGTRIQSSKSEPIPDAVMLAGRISSDATRLETEGQQSVNDFGALQVRRSAFDAAVAQIKDAGVPE